MYVCSGPCRGSVWHLPNATFDLSPSILDHVTCGSTLAPGVAPADTPSRDAIAREKEGMLKLKVSV